VEEHHCPLLTLEEEIKEIHEIDLEDYRVVEESITSVRREEEEVHQAVDDFFKALCEGRLRTWMRAKNNGMTATICSPQIPVSRFDITICEIRMTAAARRKAA
jgi:hypothetical protein